MAFYKKPCINCGALVEADARFCPKCRTNSPFAILCPTCLRKISRNDAICSGCGRELNVICPHCGGTTFAGGVCDKCGKSLLMVCPNKRCGALQFFQNTKCNACGKKLEPIKYNQAK